MAVIDQDKVVHNLEDWLDLGEYQIKTHEEETKKIRIVFMGTPSFAVPILEGLIENYEVVLVVCQPDKKKDRKGKIVIPDTKRVALDHHVEVFQPVRLREDYQKILDLNPDMIVTCAYGQMIPDEILSYPKYGCINVHGSLLPKLRGGAPIHWAIINGDEETGMTIMKMVSKMDAGDIIAQRKLKIGEEEILDLLYMRMSILGKELLLDTIPRILDGTANYIQQDESKVTFGFNVTKEDAKIHFERKSIEVKNLVRGLNSVPAAYCFLDNKRMKVYQVEIIKASYSKGKIGEIVAVDSDGMIVQCGDGFIKILEIALEGKKRCLAHDYFNGIRKESLVGMVLE